MHLICPHRGQFVGVKSLQHGGSFQIHKCNHFQSKCVALKDHLPSMVGTDAHACEGCPLLALQKTPSMTFRWDGSAWKATGGYIPAGYVAESPAFVGSNPGDAAEVYAQPVRQSLWPLGDQVESALSMVGITKERVSSWIGAPCKCPARQAKLNRLGDWAMRLITGQQQAPDAQAELDQMIS